MDILSKIDELLIKNKEDLNKQKDEIIKDINEYIQFHFCKDDLKSLFSVRTFINEQQSYFALTFTFAPPIVQLKDIDISKLAPDIVLKAYQDAIKINEELRTESEKIYSKLLPKPSE